MPRASQRCQVKLSRPHGEVSPPPWPGTLQMRISPLLWFSSRTSLKWRVARQLFACSQYVRATAPYQSTHHYKDFRLLGIARVLESAALITLKATLGQRTKPPICEAPVARYSSNAHFTVAWFSSRTSLKWRLLGNCFIARSMSGQRHPTNLRWDPIGWTGSGHN